jgi:hypothetical protein
MTQIVGVSPRLCLGGWRTIARWLPLSLLIGVAGSCARDDIAAPNRLSHAPTDGPRRTTTTLGTYTMPIYATNTANNGTLTLTPTGYIIPANTYFRIRIRGSVIVTSNPAYLAAYGSNCCSEDGTYGPGGTAYVNELRVQAQIRYTDNSGTLAVNFPGLGYGPSAPDSAVSAIMFASKAAEVWVGRNGINGSQNDNCCNWLIGMYSMAGSQTATVEVLTNFVHLTPAPAAVKAGQTVHFQMSLDDGTPATVWQWSWTKDPGSNANPISGCANAWDFCNGTVWGPGTLSGRTDYGWASAHVIVYNNFTVTADSTTVHRGDSVTFTSKYDGTPGPAARWKWIPDDTSSDQVACPSGSSGCRKAIHGPGKMWAFTATSGGDSASVHIAALSRKLLLSPSDTIWVWKDSLVDFEASAEGGAQLIGLRWLWDELGSSQPVGARSATMQRRAQRPMTAVGTSTCADGIKVCEDQVLDSYVRSVKATVDDSAQTKSVAVMAVDMPPSLDSASLILPEPTNPKELGWCFLPPTHLPICNQVRPMRDTALKIANDSAAAHDTVAVDNKYDAWRHALWSALMTYAFGAEIAKQIGDNHEYGQIDSPIQKVHKSSCMDLVNNQRGREIALAHMPQPSLAQLISYITQAVNLQTSPFDCPNTKPW